MTSNVQETSFSDLEELAAYIDGRLEDERRKAVEARLLQDEDYYEIFTESVRSQEEEEAANQATAAQTTADQETDDLAHIASFPRHRRRILQIALPLAAALLISLASLLVRSSPPALDVHAAAVEGTDWDDPGWYRNRSGSPTNQYMDKNREQLAFRLGVRLVDFHTALSAARRNRAILHAHDLAALIDALGAPLLSYQYSELAEQIETTLSAETLSAEPLSAESAETDSAETDSAETLLTEALSEPLKSLKNLDRAVSDLLQDSASEARHLAFGKWAETGRLAARTENRELLHWLVHKSPVPRRLVAAHEGQEATLQRLREALTTPEPASPEDRELVKDFVQIIRELAG